MGLFGIGNKPQAQSDPMQGGYGATLTVTQGDTAFNTAAKVYALADVAAGVTARIWEFSVPPRYLYAWGAGDKGLINNQGYLWFVLSDKATDFQVDRVALGVESYDRHIKKVVYEFVDSDSHLTDVTTEATATPTANNTKMLALPRTNVVAMPYSRLYIDITVLVAGTTLDVAAFGIPVTVKSA